MEVTLSVLSSELLPSHNYSVDLTDTPPVRLSLSMKTWGTCLYLTVYLWIWFAIVSLNLLVILAFYQDSKLRRCPSNHFLLSLAVADLLTGMIALPLNLIVRLLRSEVTCYSTSRKYFFLPVILFGGCSLLHLLLIAIDRYIAVMRPLLYPIIVTRKRVKIFLLIVWTVCLVNFSSQLIISIFFKSKSRGTNICTNSNYDKTQDSYYLYLAYSVLAYFCLMCLCYLRIYFTARKLAISRKQRRYPWSETQPDDIGRIRAIRTSVTMSIVVGACGICWVPTSFKIFLEVYGNFKSLFGLGVFCEIVLFANSMVNPIIYGWRYPEFGSAYQKVLRTIYYSLIPHGKDERSQ